MSFWAFSPARVSIFSHLAIKLRVFKIYSGDAEYKAKPCFGVVYCSFVLILLSPLLMNTGTLLYLQGSITGTAADTENVGMGSHTSTALTPRPSSVV